jgi:thiamine thiazole synthase
MKSPENLISSAIVSKFCDKLLDGLSLDVAIVGGGPSALVAARDLASRNIKVAIFERKLAPGGGTWGGGMLFNEVVVQDAALGILDDFGIRHEALADSPGYHTLDSVEMASGLIFGALRAGAKIFNSVSVEDIVFKDGKVNGLVINWTPVERLGMHVDPLTVISECVLDGTGHPSEIIRLATDKAKIKLDTPTGGILGEKIVAEVYVDDIPFVQSQISFRALAVDLDLFGSQRLVKHRLRQCFYGFGEKFVKPLSRVIGIDGIAFVHNVLQYFIYNKSYYTT